MTEKGYAIPIADGDIENWACISVVLPCGHAETAYIANRSPKNLMVLEWRFVEASP